MKKFIFFFMRLRKLVLLPQDNRHGCWHLDWGHATVVTMHGICFATTWHFSKLRTLHRRWWWNLLSLNVGWWYSGGANAWSLHPYTCIRLETAPSASDAAISRIGVVRRVRSHSFPLFWIIETVDEYLTYPTQSIFRAVPLTVRPPPLGGRRAQIWLAAVRPVQ